ncbi:MAG: hypothetical protein MPJ24_05830 [Pirellulaceae bacterium]|nr:hypothetical protein [Pirellulaceae bacterium]
MLPREEYVEQSHFFEQLGKYLNRNIAMQEALIHIRHELLATTKLPIAVDLLLAELKHGGSISPAMKRLSHYFSPFQIYVIAEAEEERGRFEFGIALEILHKEAQYRSGEISQMGLFFYEFEAICRNRLKYEKGLTAMAKDPTFPEEWQKWILLVRREVGLIELAELVYRESAFHEGRKAADTKDDSTEPLFGEREGKIAKACRQKDPLHLFSALQRQLAYPTVPRPKPVDNKAEIITQLLRRLDRVEARVKLLEEEGQTGMIDLAKFYGPQG